MSDYISREAASAVIEGEQKKLLWKRNYCPSCGRKMDLEE